MKILYFHPHSEGKTFIDGSFYVRTLVPAKALQKIGHTAITSFPAPPLDYDLYVVSRYLPKEIMDFARPQCQAVTLPNYVATDDDYETRLEYLIANKDFREALAREQRAFVVKNRLIDHNIPLWERAYNSLFS